MLFRRIYAAIQSSSSNFEARRQQKGAPVGQQLQLVKLQVFWVSVWLAPVGSRPVRRQRQRQGRRRTPDGPKPHHHFRLTCCWTPPPPASVHHHTTSTDHDTTQTSETLRSWSSSLLPSPDTLPDLLPCPLFLLRIFRSRYTPRLDFCFLGSFSTRTVSRFFDCRLLCLQGTPPISSRPLLINRAPSASITSARWPRSTHTSHIPSRIASECRTIFGQ